MGSKARWRVLFRRTAATFVAGTVAGGVTVAGLTAVSEQGRDTAPTETRWGGADGAVVLVSQPQGPDFQAAIRRAAGRSETGAWPLGPLGYGGTEIFNATYEPAPVIVLAHGGGPDLQGGGDVVLVPTPGSVAVLGLGALLVARRRRGRRY